ncbi:15-hydroxyprostaglandin dehydrogenase [NAD(+)]-like [Chrysoperla carnea]|uniref:15-hydroxyprostaglandin dehydrogenase [NAD(+)]-like n=1 Tax=Chrysoperla carnea TaxID=189513 RepID=UPI001D084932|nr:15-hydroxyprostaglandin dehydrogenase [NAD(+)]-like [Chrysoperla carnea]
MVKDSVALVTGGASGIGLATVEQLLENNAREVYIVDINQENGENALKTLGKKYGNDRVKFLKLDVTNLEDFRNIFEKIIKESGRVDILINNAGVLVGDKVLDINIGGVLNGLKLAMIFMKKGSKIINTASKAGLRGQGQCAEYIASKHAVVGLTKAFSASYWYDKTQISVMAICPGMTESPLVHTIPNTEANQDLIKFFNILRKTAQLTESVAKSMVTILKVGKNGSFWISEDNKLFEIEFPVYTDLIKREVPFF